MPANIFFRRIPKHSKFSLVGAHDQPIMIYYVQAHGGVFKEIPQIFRIRLKWVKSFGFFVHRAPTF